MLENDMVKKAMISKLTQKFGGIFKKQALNGVGDDIAKKSFFGNMKKEIGAQGKEVGVIGALSVPFAAHALTGGAPKNKILKDARYRI